MSKEGDDSHNCLLTIVHFNERDLYSVCLVREGSNTEDRSSSCLTYWTTIPSTSHIFPNRGNGVPSRRNSPIVSSLSRRFDDSGKHQVGRGTSQDEESERVYTTRHSMKGLGKDACVET